jgi:hypothetical protein
VDVYERASTLGSHEKWRIKLPARKANEQAEEHDVSLRGALKEAKIGGMMMVEKAPI